MTYNIRLDTPVDGPDRWTYRRAGVGAQIDWFRPDIFGLQEVVFNQKQDMIASQISSRGSKMFLIVRAKTCSGPSVLSAFESKSLNVNSMK
jgi:mRNA deadenylase 3'-5' endonuclease subunit Ccr4